MIVRFFLWSAVEYQTLWNTAHAEHRTPNAEVSPKIYTRKCRNGGYSTYMYPDENAEHAARKETQAFDPSLVDEEGINSKQAAQDAETTLLKQEQRDEEMDEEPSRSEGWQTFQTP
jgi:hypothetical protein